MITYIEAGGESYKLYYNCNSLCAYEDKFSAGIVDALAKASASNLRSVLWAGLIAKQPEITLAAAGVIIDDYLQDKDKDGEQNTAQSLIKILVEALTNCGFFSRPGSKQKPTEPEQAEAALKAPEKA